MFLQTSICLCLFSAVTLFAASLNPASVLLRFLVVADAHEEDVTRVFCNLSRIVLLPYLVDGCIDRVIELKLNDQCWLADVAARNHNEVGIALASGIFAMDDILVPCPDVGNGQHAC